MKTLHNNYCNSKQGYLPLFLSDCLDLLDPVLTFDRLMGGIDLNKYLTDIPEYTTGRLRYNPVNMLKTVLFGFMTSGYCSLRELEDNCKVNIRFMYLMDHQTPSYRTFGYFINEILQDKIENIFNDINHAIFNNEHVDLQHLYIDGSKFEANANKYTWVWKKATEKFRYKFYEKITAEIEEINAEIAWSGVQITTNPEYVPDYLNEIVEQLVLLWELDTSTFVYGSGKRKSKEQRHYEHLTTFCQKLQEYIQKLKSVVLIETVTLKQITQLPLEQEVLMVQKYLDIQKVRYEDLFEYKTQIEKDLEKYMMLKICLQPLVENALYHGIKESEEYHGTIWIRAFSEGDEAFVLVVEDDGAGMSEEKWNS